MQITLYGIPNCDTVKKARTWLADQGIAYEFHDFKKAGADPALLAAWAGETSWELLLNRRGTTWRALSDAEREGAVDANSAIALMTASPSLIKRPVLAAQGAIHVGFTPAMYAQIFSGATRGQSAA